MKLLSDSEISEIKNRAELATPGPWDTYPSPWAIRSHWHVSIGKQGNHRHHVGNIWWQQKQDKIIDTATASWTTIEQAQHNSEFIAHAREDVPALVAKVEQLQELLKQCMNANPDTRRYFTLDELCAALVARGITLDARAAHAGRLEVDAPRGALTPDLRAALAFHRRELLAVLAALPTMPTQPEQPEPAAGGDA